MRAQVERAQQPPRLIAQPRAVILCEKVGHDEVPIALKSRELLVAQHANLSAGIRPESDKSDMNQRKSEVDQNVCMDVVHQN